MSGSQQQQRPQVKQRLKWTEGMKSALLDCKKKAKAMVELKDQAVMVGGRKKGYMEVMK